MNTSLSVPSSSSSEAAVAAAARDGCDETKERRSSIQLIMSHPKLTNEQRRHSIQILMDGRRRSSYGTSFAEAAKNVAAEFVALQFEDTDQHTDDVCIDVHTDVGIDAHTDDVCIDAHQIQDIGAHQIHSSHSHSRTCHTHTTANLTNDTNTTNTGTPHSSPMMTMIAYNVFTGQPIGNPKLMEQQKPHCSHYRRNCSIISPCCGMVFGCRLCHDECHYLSPPSFCNIHTRSRNNNNNNYNNNYNTSSTTANENNNNNNNNNHHHHRHHHHRHHDAKQKTLKSTFSRRLSLPTTSISSTTQYTATKRRLSFNSSLNSITDDIHHTINRHDIQEIICRKCYTRQSSKTNTCITCNIQFGEYHCPICNLWMDDTAKPYHCSKCGICRVGGEANFQHCDKCGMCIYKELIHDHNCHAGKFMSSCPVCYEDLFTSREACHELPCNHSIHWHCFCEWSSIDIRCPICKKTMITNEQDKYELWNGLKEDIELQPLPPDQTKVVDIVCNDCEVSQSNRRWHPLGVDCHSCGSFNTSLLGFKMVGIEAYNFLAQLEEIDMQKMQMQVEED